MLKTPTSRYAPIPLLLLLPLVAGCASKGYVNDRIAELRQNDAAEHERLSRETADLRNSTEAAMSRAGTAFETAAEARDLALGKSGLEEVDRYSVHFAFASDRITDEQAAVLDKAAEQIRMHPEVVVDVYGFADPVGPESYNLDLAERRAGEVLRYLVASGSGQLSRYAAVSFGERELAGMVSSEAPNPERRCVIVSLIRRISSESTDSPSAEVHDSSSAGD